MKMKFLFFLLVFIFLSACDNSSSAEDNDYSSSSREANSSAQTDLKEEQNKLISDFVKRISEEKAASEASFQDSSSDNNTKSLEENFSQELIKEYINSIDEETLQSILDSLGITKDELYELIELFDNIDLNKEPEINVSCKGSLNDDKWEMTADGNLFGFKTSLLSTISFEEMVMTSTDVMKIDLKSEKICEQTIQSFDEEEEIDDDEQEEIELYGEIQSETNVCDGQYLISTTVRIKQEVTADAKETAYQESVGKCKDYESGKISFEELTK